MSFKHFYGGDSGSPDLNKARHLLRNAYDEADESRKAQIEKTFDQKIKEFWPILPNHEAEVLAIVTEIIREATASGI
jgi:hypothetical protein